MTFSTGDDDDEDKDLTDDAAINRSISVGNENPQTLHTSLMTFLTGDEDDAHDDEDKDLTDDAAINRSISVDNENPQTPDEKADMIADLFPTGIQHLMPHRTFNLCYNPDRRGLIYPACRSLTDDQ